MVCVTVVRFLHLPDLPVFMKCGEERLGVPLLCPLSGRHAFSACGEDLLCGQVAADRGGVVEAPGAHNVRGVEACRRRLAWEVAAVAR